MLIKPNFTRSLCRCSAGFESTFQGDPLCLSALGGEAKTNKPAPSAVFDTSFDPILMQAEHIGRRAHKDANVGWEEPSQGLNKEKMRENAHEPSEGPHLEDAQKKLDCSQSVNENQKQMLATVQSLIELVIFWALPVCGASASFRDFLLITFIAGELDRRECEQKRPERG